MKRNLVLLFTVAMVMSAVFIGCKKDDDKNGDDKKKKNQITYDGKEYELSFGILEFWGDYYGSGAYNFDVSLFSSGITFDTVTEIPSGIGHLVWLELFSTSETQLVPGTYTFANTQTYAANTFEEAGFAINFNVATLTGEIEREFTSGTIKVGKTGNIYEFTIDAIADDGKAVNIYYQGAMLYYDESKKKSRKD